MPWIGKEKNFWPWLWIPGNRLKARLHSFVYNFLLFWRFQLGSLRSKRFHAKDSLGFKALSPSLFCALKRTRYRISRQQWRKCVLNSTIAACSWKLYGDTTCTNTVNDSVLIKCRICNFYRFAHLTWTKPTKGSTYQVSYGAYPTRTHKLEESTKALQFYCVSSPVPNGLCKCACLDSLLKRTLLRSFRKKHEHTSWFQGNTRWIVTF